MRAKAAPFEGINAGLGQGSRVCSLPEIQTHYALLSPFGGCLLRPSTTASGLESWVLLAGGVSQLVNSCARCSNGYDRFG